VREWFRHSRADLPPGFDLVVIARQPAAGLGGREIAEALSVLAFRQEGTERSARG
jgi:ribonuclease P protein component